MGLENLYDELIGDTVGAFVDEIDKKLTKETVECQDVINGAVDADNLRCRIGDEL